MYDPLTQSHPLPKQGYPNSYWAADVTPTGKNKLENTHQAVINEVRDDVKAIFRTLTKMQVDHAKTEGQEADQYQQNDKEECFFHTC